MRPIWVTNKGAIGSRPCLFVTWGCYLHAASFAVVA